MDMITTWEKFFSPVTAEDIRNFATTIGDLNPIHHDDEAARATGMRGIIAPGVMIIGFISSTIAQETPRAMVRRIDIKFINPTHAGSALSVQCVVLEQRRNFVIVDVTVRNGEEIVAQGKCSLILPC